MKISSLFKTLELVWYTYLLQAKVRTIQLEYYSCTGATENTKVGTIDNITKCTHC